MKSLFSSISNAIQGIMYVFKREKNFKIQLCIALVVICISLFFQISRVEWLFILSLIFLVLSLELLNSAFEKITDILKPRLVISETKRSINPVFPESFHPMTPKIFILFLYL